MNISCSVLDAALAALVSQIGMDRSYFSTLVSVSGESVSVAQLRQKISASEGAYNDLLNVRLAQFGVPE